jgi:2-oxo-4-hydroxy-4-carboxy--5-ureidoimidazoline (OHCU) decarboxylase
VRGDLADVFERAPALAERVLATVGEGADPARVIGAARRELALMSDAERARVLDAHPRIGADAASLSPLSRSEQGPGTDAATARELADLNDEYERRFGFRFVVWVRGRTRQQIVPVLRERLANDRDAELATGIEEFLAITRDRLEQRA